MSRKLRRLLRPALTLLFLAALAAGGWWLRGFFERPPEVAVGEVLREDVARILALTGRVRPQLRNRIAPAVRARLLEVALEEGDAVQSGQVIARLDARPVQASLSQVRAQIERAGEELVQRQRDLERAEALAKSDLLAPSELEDARLRVEVGRRESARLAEQASELEARLDDYVLRSPIDGWVLERPVDPGQTVGPEEAIYELATGDGSLVEVEVDERYLGELRMDQAATVALISGKRDSWQTKISYISKRIDRSSGAALIRLAFVEDAPELPVGLSLDVNLLIEEHPEALTVPRSAVAGLGGERQWVMAVEADRTVERVVKIVDWPAPRLLLLSGLEVGDRVALAPKKVPEDIAVRPFDGVE